MKVIIIDDEPAALENFSYAIKQYENVEVMGVFTDPLEALERLEALKSDAVFLDIEMPQMNGFTVAEEIYEILPDVRIIFITGYDEYAVKAFDINAIDYVLKPVSRSRLKQTIEKLSKSWGEILDDRSSSLFRKQINKVIAWRGDRIVLLDPDQVLYFYADEGNVIVVTQRECYRVKETLNYWEERMSQLNFFRCHRAFLINIDKIRVILPMFNNTYHIRFANHPDIIPVSRKYAKELKRILRY